MFKDNATEKLIEYIQTLPLNEQKVIAESIAKTKSTIKPLTKKTTQKKIEAFTAYTKKFTGRLPKNYKFNREEANER
jgi:hypothetical protein